RRARPELGPVGRRARLLRRGAHGQRCPRARRRDAARAPRKSDSSKRRPGRLPTVFVAQPRESRRSQMNVLFVAGIAVVAADPPKSRELLVDALGLPLEAGEGEEY